ncbi:hypothetical protein AB0F52_14500 [Amycolatopsis sp. NPDC024027]|uniref:hypothetical protein n=1 Tax=Amycolatopsis sp. NPDC024027 TaxID=3154327 RepID=UPI0033E75487
MGKPVADRRVVVDLAREVVAEVAPDELGLFPERCRAYFRHRKGHGRDPLAMGIEAWTSVATFAVLSTVQSVLVFVAAEFKKGVEEEGASTIRAWIRRGFRRLAPPTDESDRAVVVVDPAGGETARGGEEPRGIPWTEEQLGRIRAHAYGQALEFKVPPARASKLADTIVAKLVLPGSGDD